MPLVNSASSLTDCGIFLALSTLLPLAVKGAITFTSPYGGTSVCGAVGSSVTFTWRFSGALYQADWSPKKDGVSDITILVSLNRNGMLQVTPPAGYSGRVSGTITANSSSGQAVFTLSDIKTYDERLFGCKIESSDIRPDRKFDSVQLVVEEPPIITEPTSGNVMYNEGTPVNLSCKATGKPHPDVRWIHNGQVKISGSKTAYLPFILISKKDAGTYTCRANNSAGNIEKRVTVSISCLT